MLAWFTRRRQQQKTAQKLYGSIVAQARNPWFFRTLGVSDTLEGRFEILVMHVYLALHRLKADESLAPLGQALVDTFFDDMDVIHRELGVSDLKVPKKMYSTAGVFYERLDRYARAFSEEDEQALTQIFSDCMFGGETSTDRAEALAAYSVRAAQLLGQQTESRLRQGDISFVDPETIATAFAEAG